MIKENEALTVGEDEVEDDGIFHNGGNDSDDKDDGLFREHGNNYGFSRCNTYRYCRLEYPLEYIWILHRIPGYRWYLLSHVCQDVGDWFVKIGALVTVQRLANTASGSAIGYLMLTIMLPQLFLSPVGGMLADSFDRRKLMLGLDVSGGLVVFGYLLALKYDSIPMLYTVSTLRTSISSVYDPITRSLLPMIVTDSVDLKRAVSLNYLAWSIMRIIGGLIAGFLGAYMGVGACFVVDMATYFLSAIFLFLLKGNFRVRTNETSGNSTTVAPLCSNLWQPLMSFAKLTSQLCAYLWASGFGLILFLRSSGAAIWGWADVLNVTYTHVENDEKATSRRLGILMSFLGLGCLVGPVVANFFTNPNRPQTLECACVYGMAVMTLGWVGIFLSPTSFYQICIFSAVRTLGAAILITNSTLLLQRVVAPEFLGRVLSLEFAVAMGVDSFSNWMAGLLQDKGLDKEQIEAVAIIIGSFLTVFWTAYHRLLGGASRLEECCQDEESFRPLEERDTFMSDSEDSCRLSVEHERTEQ